MALLIVPSTKYCGTLSTEDSYISRAKFVLLLKKKKKNPNMLIEIV